MTKAWRVEILDSMSDNIIAVELRVIRALTAAYALFLLAEILAAVVGRP